MGIIAFLILAAVIGIPIYLRWEKRIEAEEQAMRKRRAAEAERRYAEEQRQKKLEKAVQEAEDRARKEAEAGGYGEYFDLLQYLRKTHQPEYKIDWLLKSLKMGRKLDNGGEYVYESMKENLPYFCETAGEYSFFHEMPASMKKQQRRALRMRVIGWLRRLRSRMMRIRSKGRRRNWKRRNRWPGRIICAARNTTGG